MRHDSPGPTSAELFLRHSADMMSVQELDGRLAYVSPACSTLLGYDPEELLGKVLVDLVHPDDRAEVWAWRERIIELPEVRFECRVRDKSGSYRWIESSFRLVCDEQGAPFQVHGTSRDISARRLADSRFELALQHAPIGMALVSPDGEFLLTNPALNEMLGYADAELQGATFQSLTHPEDLDADLELVREALDGERTGYRIDKRYRRKDDSYLWATLAVVLVRDAGGDPLYFISQILDISERKELEEQLAAAARVDALTGVANRFGALDHLERLDAEVRRTGQVYGVCFCDLAGFKTINDRHGHGVGDQVLQMVAARLSRAVRPDDLVARWGGDEFVVILTSVDTTEELEATADRLRESVSRSVELSGIDIVVEIDVGTSLGSPGRGIDINEVIDRADQDMYRRRTEAQGPIGSGPLAVV